MKKRIWIGMLLAAILALCAFALCSCGGAANCDHQYQGTVSQERTCETDEIITYTCALCQHTYSMTTPALGHDLVNHSEKTPTCTEAGWDAYATCSRCDYTTYEEKPALEHDEIEHEAKSPTCTEIGWDAYVTCSRCDYTTYVEKAALTHDEVIHDAKSPTCTEIGWEAYVACSRCDYTTYEEKPALEHDEIEHEAKAPTCTEYGWDAYVTCSRCDYTTYEEKPALEHDEIEHEAKAPTCTEYGWDAYVTCSRCNYTTYEEKPAGHDVIEHEAKAPTCIEYGWDAYITCSRCDYTTYEEKPAGHAVIEHEAKAPNCVDIGWDAYVTCSRCNYTTYEELLPHTMENGECIVCHTPESTPGLSYKFNSDSKSYTVTGIGTCTESDIVIGIYNGYSVTSIGEHAFYKRTRLKSIVIPDSVTSIGDKAFYECTSLVYNEYDNAYYLGNGDNPYLVLVKAKDSAIQSCAINEKTKIIYSQAFYGCKSLTSITVDKNNVSYKSIDGNLYTKDGKTLIQYATGKKDTEFKVPNGVTSIGFYAFYYCTSLTSVVIPDSVTSIGDEAFAVCLSLTSVVIPDSVTSIGKSAFSDCRSLTSIVIPDSVTSIGKSAFYYCRSLTIYCEAENQPRSWHSDWNVSGGSVVWGCTGFGISEEGILWASTSGDLYIIGYRGTNTELIIPETINGKSVTSIGKYAFCDCTSLTSVVIPDSVTSIGDDAFYGCTSLTIYCEATSQPSGWDSDWNYSKRPVVWGYKGE